MDKMKKELLIKDLSSRLPYNVKCQFEDTIEIVKSLWFCEDEDWQVDGEKTSTCIHAVKPYLFPISSMTEEQKEEYCSLQQKVIYNSKGLINSDVMEYVNWCYKNHIDINNLIPMGLALDATNKNIY